MATVSVERTEHKIEEIRTFLRIDDLKISALLDSISSLNIREYDTYWN